MPKSVAGWIFYQPTGWQVRFVFTKLVAPTPTGGKQAQQTIAKTVLMHLKTSL